MPRGWKNVKCPHCETEKAVGARAGRKTNILCTNIACKRLFTIEQSDAILKQKTPLGR